MAKKKRGRKWLISLGILVMVIASAIGFRHWYLPALQSARIAGLSCNGPCLSRLWVHRVNTVQRYDILKDKFTGFELDVIYDTSKNAFKVCHPPLQEDDVAVDLAEFIAHTDSNHRFWLDIRDLDSNNVTKALTVLAAIDSHGWLKKHAIIELYDELAAAAVTRNGYTVSFNVWNGFAAKMIADPAFRSYAGSVLKDVAYVSREADFVPELKQLFPGKRIITWQPGLRNFLNRSKLRELLKDPVIDIILITVESRFYR